MYDFVSILVSVHFLPMCLPRLPRSRIDRLPPPLKTAYNAYHRYFSGKMYEFVSILISVYILTNRLPRLPRNPIDNSPPPSHLKTAYYAYHMIF